MLAGGFVRLEVVAVARNDGELLRAVESVVRGAEVAGFDFIPLGGIGEGLDEQKVILSMRSRSETRRVQRTRVSISTTYLAYVPIIDHIDGSAALQGVGLLTTCQLDLRICRCLETQRHSELSASEVRLDFVGQDVQHHVDALLSHETKVEDLQLMMPRLDIVICLDAIVWDVLANARMIRP